MCSSLALVPSFSFSHAPLTCIQTSSIANESFPSADRSSINSWIHLRPDHRQQRASSMDGKTI